MNFLIGEDKRYYEIDYSKMRLYSFYNSWIPIDENAPYWTKGIIFNYDDWTDLCIHTGWDPFDGDIDSNIAWLAPNGRIISCESHEVTAKDIVKIFYSKDIEEAEEDAYGVFLLNHGWHRLSDTLMWTYYILYNWTVTKKQYDVLHSWCYKHDMLEPRVTITYT